MNTNVSPYYFEDTASLLNGALSLIDQCNPNGIDRALASVSSILEIARDRLLDEKLDPIIEHLEKSKCRKSKSKTQS